jgi:hypothetical protein
MILVNNISARNFSRREVGGPAQRLQAGVRQLTGEHSTPTLDFFRLSSDFSRRVLSIVSIVALCGVWRQAQQPNSLTPLGSVLSSAAVVEKYYVAHLPRLLLYPLESCATSACAARP